MFPSNSSSPNSGGYGSGSVSNRDGYGVADLAEVWSNKMIVQGASISFKLLVSGTADLSDVVGVELSQRLTASGSEISKQAIPFN
jgi:chitinase